MKRLITALILMATSTLTLAAAGGGEYITHAPINPSDKVSLQNGMRLFVNNCLGCHSAKYMRYERAADDLGIPHDIMAENLMFTADKIGETMQSAIPQDMAKSWFGAAPPDLTLTARSRGADWVYSYLTNFYPDESRPWNVNNHVFPDVGMPWVLANMEASMSEKEFKTAMADLTNYMVYMAEPIQQERKRLGVYVLLFLAILFIPVYFLNREYWKDIH